MREKKKDQMSVIYSGSWECDVMIASAKLRKAGLKIDQVPLDSFFPDLSQIRMIVTGITNAIFWSPALSTDSNLTVF